MSANKDFPGKVQSPQRDVARFGGFFLCNGSSTPTAAQQQGGAMATVARTGTAKYTVTLSGITFPVTLGFGATFTANAASGICAEVQSVVQSSGSTVMTINLVTMSTGAQAADQGPATNVGISWWMDFSNSAVTP
jgi:hypothetical protein